MTREPIHWSTLKHLARSAAHYHYAASHPFEPTAPMRLGTACHALLLGATWPLVVYSGASRRNKGWTEFRDVTLREQPGATILLQSEMDVANSMAASVLRCPDAMAALDGTHELELGWTIAGRRCAGRLDVCGRRLTDLKSTRNASPAAFPWDVRKMLYDGQMGWYYDGAIAAGHPEPDKVSIVAVENTAPYCVVVYDFSPERLELGRRRARALLEQLLVCEAADEWPGYTQSPVVLDVMDQDGDAGLDFGEEEAAT